MTLTFTRAFCSEILKNLALSGISDVHVIDLDSIDITNCESIMAAAC